MAKRMLTNKHVSCTIHVYQKQNVYFRYGLDSLETTCKVAQGNRFLNDVSTCVLCMPFWNSFFSSQKQTDFLSALD